MSEPKTQQEPTMEEILASIRRIISEDGDEDAKQPAGDAAPAAPAVSVVDEDVLELTQMVKEDGSVVNLTDARAAHPSAEARNEQPAPAPRPTPAAEPVKPLQAAPAEEPLVSPKAAAAATSAFSNLSSAVAAGSRPMPIGDGQRTVEDLIKELLRPVLKQWLDENLPEVVNRVVEREVAKLARRAEEDAKY